MATGRQFDLTYMVEQWDDSDSHVEELIGLTGDYRVARAAYEEAVKRRPGRIVTLSRRQGLALVDIDNYGEQLTGCLTCNHWYTAEGKRKKLSEEDLRALYLLKHGGAK